MAGIQEYFVANPLLWTLLAIFRFSESPTPTQNEKTPNTTATP